MSFRIFLLSLFLILPAAHAQFAPLPDDGEPQFTNAVHGVVLDDTGRPVPDAPVFAILGGQDGSPSYVVFTDATGRFAFNDIEDGYWYISVDHEAYAREWDFERNIKIPAPVESLPITITLARPQYLSGRVIDERGAPVPEANVILVMEWLDGRDGTPQRNSSYDVQAVVADAEGRFSLSRLRPGAVTLVLEHPRFAQTRVSKLPTGTDSNTLTINDGTTLSGIVTADGEPVAGVRVSVSSLLLGKRSCGEWEVVTDAKGRFAAGPVPNLKGFDHSHVFAAHVSEPGWRSDLYCVYQYEDDVLPEVAIAAEPGDSDLTKMARIEVGKRTPEADPGATLQVVVAAPPPGKAPAEGTVMVFSMDNRTTTFMENALVNENGIAIFENVPMGEYRADFNPVSGVHHVTPARFHVTDRNPAKVTLHPGNASLEGRIPGADTRPGRQYLSWVLVDHEDGMAHQGLAQIRPDGNYEATGLTPGKYRLVYEGTNIMRNEFRIEVRPGRNHFDLNLPAGAVTGRLVGVDYEPNKNTGVGGIRIHPSETMMLSSDLFGHAHPDEDGAFHFDYVPDGRYVVSVDDRGRQRLKVRVTVSGGGTTVVELSRPQRFGQIEGVVHNLSPHVLRERTISSPSISAIPLTDYGYEFAQRYWTDVDKKTGFYCFRNLPEGMYGLKIEGNDLLPVVWVPGVEVRDGMFNIRDIELPEARKVVIHLAQGDLKTSKSIWKLRMDDGTFISYGSVIGSSGNDVAYPHEFLLACGDYVIHGDFGDGVTVQVPVNVQPGDDTMEITVRHPALAQEVTAGSGN